MAAEKRHVDPDRRSFRAAPMNIYAGTSGFSYKEWKGKFYPEKISAGEMLRFYSERLRTVEINNTFYHMPTGRLLLSWAEQVPDDFVFAIKAPQVITHLKRLKNVGEETAYLFRTLSSLGRKLGPVLLQFPGSFKMDRQALEDFLGLLPDDAACAFDFRSSTWSNAEIYDLLRRKKCALCLEDTDENPVNVIVHTAPWGYLRLRRSDYTDADLTLCMKNILSQKWKRCFVFFKHEEEETAGGPERAMRFQELAGAG